MTCCEYEDRLSAYLDGELPRWTRWKVQNHLRHCSQCSNSLRELAELDSGLLGACEVGAPPDYLTGAIMHRLPAMPPARPLRGGFMPWGAGLAVAGMQALALFGAYWWGFMRGTTTPTPSSASLVSPGGGSRAMRPTNPVTPVSNLGNQPGSSRRGPIWSHTPNGFSGVSPAELERLEESSNRTRRKPVPVGPGVFVVPTPTGSR